MITINIENENPFAAGWLACHLGLKRDCLKLEGMAKQQFEDGFKMHEECADSENPKDIHGHGGTHIAFLMEATNQNLVPFVRNRVSISTT